MCLPFQLLGVCQLKRKQIYEWIQYIHKYQFMLHLVIYAQVISLKCKIDSPLFVMCICNEIQPLPTYISCTSHWEDRSERGRMETMKYEEEKKELHPDWATGRRFENRKNHLSTESSWSFTQHKGRAVICMWSTEESLPVVKLTT